MPLSRGPSKVDLLGRPGQATWAGVGKREHDSVERLPVL